MFQNQYFSAFYDLNLFDKNIDCFMIDYLTNFMMLGN